MSEQGRRFLVRLAVFIAWLPTVALLAQEPPGKAALLKEIPRDEADTTVELDVDHPLLFPEIHDLGFRILVRGWEPDGELAVYAVGSKGEQIAIMAAEKHRKASAEGEAAIDVPYELRGLHPGHWMVVIGGAPGVHGFRMKIPKIIRPSTDPETWKVDFDAADEYERTVAEAKS